MSIEKDFTKELEQLLNKYSIDNLTETPDFILATYLVEHIESLGKMNKENAEWHGWVRLNK